MNRNSPSVTLTQNSLLLKFSKSLLSHSSQKKQSPQKTGIKNLDDESVEYICEIKEDVLEKCSLHNLKQLKQYIEENGELNYRIDFQNMAFVITAATCIRGKKAIIDLAEVRIQEVYATDSRAALQKIQKLCLSREPLTDTQIKQSLRNISSILLNQQTLKFSSSQCISKNSSPQIYDASTIESIISKIVKVGQKYDHLESRFSDIIEKTQNLHKQNEQSVDLQKITGLEIQQMRKIVEKKFISFNTRWLPYFRISDGDSIEME